MGRIGYAILAAMLALGVPALATAQSSPPSVDVQDSVQKGVPSAIRQAIAALEAKQPTEALKLADPLATELEKALSGDAQVRCVDSTEGLLMETFLATASKGTTSFVAYDLCTAAFIKGFALIDLGKRREAQPHLERAATSAPDNPQFLGELAEWYKMEKNWPRAGALFTKAAEAAQDNAGENGFWLRRAWRGLGFVKIETGDLDGAEALFKKCLEMDANDAGAKNELAYIAQERQRRR